MADHLLHAIDSKVDAPTDLAVVGGGIAGACVAWHAARQGLNVRLLEADTPTGNATWASGGMLAPKAEGLRGELLELGTSALSYWPDFVHQLSTLVDAPVAMHRGVWMPVQKEDPVDWIERHINYLQKLGYPVAEFDLATLGRIGINNRSFVGGFHFEDEGWVDPRAVLIALLRGLRMKEVIIETGVRVRSLELTGERPRLVTTAGEREANHVVIAAGRSAARIEGLRWSGFGSIYGDRGLMVRVHGIAPPPGVLYHHGTETTTYIVPDPHGIRLGSTSTPFDERTEPAADELAGLLERGERLWPHVARGSVAEVRVGFRPFGPDPEGKPFVGPLDRAERVWGILGLHRNGILFAPHLARQLVDQLHARAAGAA